MLQNQWANLIFCSFFKKIRFVFTFLSNRILKFRIESNRIGQKRPGVESSRIESGFVPITSFVCSCNVSGLSRPLLSSLRKGNIDIILSRKLLWLIELEVKNLDVFCDLWWFYFFIPEKTLFSSPSLGIKRLQTHREMLIPQL